MVGTARAEGAWVLWKKDFRTPPPEWEILGAYPSYEICIQEERLECERQAKAYSHTKKTSECVEVQGGYYHMVDGLHGGTLWKCLPESVDPRK